MRRIAFVFAALALAVVLVWGAYSGTPVSARTTSTAKPNIIFIVTDDLDAKSISRMPYLRKYLTNQGITFKNAFVTTSLCCPSRATILRGQYAHNHRILTNQPPLGGAEGFRSKGRENSTVATWLHGGGYKTVLIGKYLNGFVLLKPPGWDGWYTKVPAGTYHTDYYGQQAANFIRGMKGTSKPFFMWLGTRAPHDPADPAPRHADAFPGATAPRPPSFNEADVSDKPAWISSKSPLTATQIKFIDQLHRKRLQSMLAVDEMIKRIVDSLRYNGKLSNTYIVFTSDNGYTMGQHRRLASKWTAYEEDIRVPLIVRGPGVPWGAVRQHMVLNNDFAPTFAALSRVSAPAFVDGRSFVPLLKGNPPAASSWRSAFLEEAAYNPRNRPALKAIRTRKHLWVEYASGERELYNLQNDPYELRSLHRTASADFKRHLSSRLAALRGCAGNGCRSAEGF